jgi:hypothetical protein
VNETDFPPEIAIVHDPPAAAGAPTFGPEAPETSVAPGADDVPPTPEVLLAVLLHPTVARIKIAAIEPSLTERMGLTPWVEVVESSPRLPVAR